MQGEVTTVRRRKRPSHLRLSSIAKAIRTSLYGASSLASPKGSSSSSSSSVEMINYGSVPTPGVLLSSCDNSPHLISPENLNKRLSRTPSPESSQNSPQLSPSFLFPNKCSPQTPSSMSWNKRSLKKTSGPSSSKHSSKPTSNTTPFQYSTRPPSTCPSSILFNPVYELNNNLNSSNNNNNRDPGELSITLCPPDNENGYPNHIWPPLEDNSPNHTWTPMEDIFPNGLWSPVEEDTFLSLSTSSVVSPVKSLSLSRKDAFRLEEEVRCGTEGYFLHYSEDGVTSNPPSHYVKNPKSSKIPYATMRFPKARKKAGRTLSSEEYPLSQEYKVKEVVSEGFNSGRRATVSHIYKSEHWKRNNGWSNVDVLGDGRNLSKSDKKNFEKTNKLNIHLMALFNAVEYGQLEKARTILQNNTFNINSVNQDGFTVLEISVLMGNVSIVKTLQQAGATESNAEHRWHYLDDLLFNAERKRNELSGAMVGGNYPKETEKEHLKWDRRVKFLRKMKIGLEKLQVPKAPASATVEVIDGTRVRIGFQEAPQQQNIVTTKFKVEWSIDEWKSVEGNLELFDLRRMSAVIEGLAQGCRHHFRVCAGNLRGYGPGVSTTPPAAVPSSWRDIDKRKPRLEGLLRELEDLFKQVRNSRPEHASEIKTIEPGQETPLGQRKAQKKKTLMQLFTHAPKFHKSLKRGSYFACIIFCEDKVLVTAEEFPPVVEVDENYLSQTQAKIHFHWLMKVASTWEDVKSLRQDMEQAGSASHLPYRIKLLQAAANMQTVLGIQDLGQFYHKPIKDSSGTYVFCTVKHVKSTKAISSMNVRWVPLAKLKERKSSGQGTSPTPNEPPAVAGDMLLTSLQEQIMYSQVSQVPLRRGLYLGYLKLQSSVDQLQVIVPGRIPNMFPHVKIRDNPHVSREEWEWIKNLKQPSWSKTDDPGGGTENEHIKFSPPTSPAQVVWRKQLTTGIQLLLQDLGVEKETWSEHRLFTGEALELNSDVTLLLLLPPLDEVCCVPGQEDTLLTQPSLMALPLHTFEMVHMGTYQGHLLGRYTRLSYILEMDMLMAQHASREAFSETEVARAKERLWQLKQFQVLLDSVWKRFRWVMDVITFARDKAVPGLSLTALCQGQKGKIDIYKDNFLDSSKLSDVSPNSLSLSSDYKRLSYDSRSSLNSRKDIRMHKSNTTENIRQLSSDDIKLPKSKTSDCIFSSADPLPCSGYTNPSSENIPLIQWKAEDTCGGSTPGRMYIKNSPTTKSDYLLQQYSDIDPPPRKSSAPSFLGSDLAQLPGLESMPRSKSAVSNYNMYSNPSTFSLNTVDKYEDKDTKCVVVHKIRSPATSCGDIAQKLGCSDKRASSSLSQGSEASFSSMTASLRSISSNDTETEKECSEERAKRLEEPSVIQVYAAYDTGLAAGTSVKLHVTTRTTSREVIDLVVKQLNMAVLLKNKNGPIYGNEKLKDFCLVAVIGGARERCLRDDFRPLQLQNPWKKGRLYVRLKQDVLAAIEQSNARHSSYL